MSHLTDDIRADYARRFPDRRVSARQVIKLCLQQPGMLACVILRVQQACSRKHLNGLANLCRTINLAATSADFLPGCVIGAGLRVEHPAGIVVGQHAIVGANCTLLQQATLGELYGDGREPHDYPVLEDGVVVGAGARVLGGVRIGARALIGANAVVLTDVPADATAVGIPARVLPANPDTG